MTHKNNIKMIQIIILNFSIKTKTMRATNNHFKGFSYNSRRVEKIQKNEMNY